MRQQVTKELYSYWNGLKGARSAPDRSDIDPAAIRQILADTFIIEVDHAFDFPIRLSGSRLDALWMTEQKGASFIDLWRGDDRRSIAAALLTVIDGVTPIVAGVRTHAPGFAPLELELLLLPLRHFGKTHSRVLGALAPNHQPDWLGQRCAGPLELLSLRVIGPESHNANLCKHAPFEATRAAGERPRLVVLEGGKS
ncbi:PAS domain-containing protein [Methylocystis sp. WRRC1]|uniref:PAS domain-containing protein n=1 Tax=Methylocystis sp. WRRC1 TaxID=1732014 RepID=UPI001D13D2E2|nr:PAS domain-containing protein [Methylocystis sp. WRRC1]MCC3244224.1 PAS domain-containing protein [Methylocystis sp. WRRC1]